jgi:hypothetical protein
MSSLLQKAEASEAAFYDPITQAFNLGTEIAGSVGTMMNLTPKAIAFKEGLFPSKPAVQPESVYGQAVKMNYAQDSINSMAKLSLGDAYAEGVNYTMDAQGKFMPKLATDFQLTGRPTDMGLNVTQPKFNYKAMTLNDIQNLAQTINFIPGDKTVSVPGLLTDIRNVGTFETTAADNTMQINYQGINYE